MPRRLSVLVLSLGLAAALHAGETRSSRLLEESQHRLAKTPRSYTARVNRGYALYRLERYEEALEDFQKAYALAGNARQRALVRYNEGNALFMLQRLPQALQAYRQGLQLDPDDEDLRYNFVVTKKILDARQQQGKQDQQQSQSGESGGQQQDPDKQDGRPQDGSQGAQRRGPEKEPSGDKGGEAPRKEGEISREDALRLLQAIADREREQKPRRPEQIRGVRKEKDW